MSHIKFMLKKSNFNYIEENKCKSNHLTKSSIFPTCISLIHTIINKLVVNLKFLSKLHTQ